MTKQDFILTAKMLRLASEQFSNNGCNDLTDDVVKHIVEPDDLCTGMRVWAEDAQWPVHTGHITDWQLMQYLAEKFEQMAEQFPEEHTLTHKLRLLEDFLREHELTIEVFGDGLMLSDEEHEGVLAADEPRQTIHSLPSVYETILLR